MRLSVSPRRALGALVTSFALLGLAVQSAHAQSLNFVLTPATRTGAAGTTVTFTGTLTNPNNFTVFLDTVDATFTDQNSANFLTILPSGNLPVSIAANSFYSGNIFDAVIDSSANRSPLFGTANVYGGTSAGSFNLLASQNFLIVPEASTAGLMAGAALPLLGAVVIRARRRKDTKTA